MYPSRILVYSGSVTLIIFSLLLFFNDYSTTFVSYTTILRSSNVTEVTGDGDGEEVTATNTFLHPFDRCILPHFDPWDEEIIPVTKLIIILTFLIDTVVEITAISAA
ncbi:hypothetical protein KIN20_037263 [Parelaphostrongylus tenuis]|uniref:Uncharacterized protein n=1 Tax=Parelaphostrongylus tenuis TaxID=148309 RepID=A0AAD5WLZ0_PARTN|nr:hypothetical protein KIN20_037263 [Parelaphostrongylus tenuis]